jgi:NDP-sugar pyrophosphorylase family protein
LQYAGYWRDIGNRDDYEAAISEFEADADGFIGSRRA